MDTLNNCGEGRVYSVLSECGEGGVWHHRERFWAQ